MDVDSKDPKNTLTKRDKTHPNSKEKVPDDSWKEDDSSKCESKMQNDAHGDKKKVRLENKTSSDPAADSGFSKTKRSSSALFSLLTSPQINEAQVQSPKSSNGASQRALQHSASETLKAIVMDSLRDSKINASEAKGMSEVSNGTGDHHATLRNLLCMSGGNMNVGKAGSPANGSNSTQAGSGTGVSSTVVSLLSSPMGMDGRQGDLETMDTKQVDVGNSTRSGRKSTPQKRKRVPADRAYNASGKVDSTAGRASDYGLRHRSKDRTYLEKYYKMDAMSDSNDSDKGTVHVAASDSDYEPADKVKFSKVDIEIDNAESSDPAVRVQDCYQVDPHGRFITQVPMAIDSFHFDQVPKESSDALPRIGHVAGARNDDSPGGKSMQEVIDSVVNESLRLVRKGKLYRGASPLAEGVKIGSIQSASWSVPAQVRDDRSVSRSPTPSTSPSPSFTGDMRSNYNSVLNMYVCEFCEAEFVRPRHLQEHLKLCPSHTRVSPQRSVMEKKPRMLASHVPVRLSKSCIICAYDLSRGNRVHYNIFAGKLRSTMQLSNRISKVLSTAMLPSTVPSSYICEDCVHRLEEIERLWEVERSFCNDFEKNLALMESQVSEPPAEPSPSAQTASWTSKSGKVARQVKKLRQRKEITLDEALREQPPASPEKEKIPKNAVDLSQSGSEKPVIPQQQNYSNWESEDEDIPNEDRTLSISVKENHGLQESGKVSPRLEKREPASIGKIIARLDGTQTRAASSDSKKLQSDDSPETINEDPPAPVEASVSKRNKRKRGPTINIATSHNSKKKDSISDDLPYDLSKVKTEPGDPSVKELAPDVDGVPEKKTDKSALTVPKPGGGLPVITFDDGEDDQSGGQMGVYVIEDDNGERKYACIRCCASFYSLCGSEFHVKCHQGGGMTELQLKCFLCGFVDETQPNQWRVMKTHLCFKHNLKDELFYSQRCDIDNCGKLFHNEQQLFQHKEYSHATTKAIAKKKEHYLDTNGFFDYSCSQCTNVFMTEEAYMLHQGCHVLGGLQFQCGLCGYTHPSQPASWRFMKGHFQKFHKDYINKRMFHSLSCNASFICKAQFPNRGILEIHAKCHVEGSDVFRCYICNYMSPTEMTNWTHMKAHLLRVHVETLFRDHANCACGRSFPSYVELEQHLRMDDPVDNTERKILPLKYKEYNSEANNLPS